MKKTVISCAVLLLAGCTCGECQKTELKTEVPVQEQKAETAVTAANAVNVAVPCSYSCAQSEGCRSQKQTVLKPRVTETVQPERKRPCCDDGAPLTGGEAKTYIPDAPEIYVISANRTVNSMQTEAAALFKQIGWIRVYIEKPVAKSDDLPGGIQKGADTLKNRFSQMDKVSVTGNRFAADYIIGSSADWYDTPTKTVPAIKYDMTVKDNGGKLIGEWSEIIHQAEGDRSWW